MTTSEQRRLLVTSGDGPRECRRAVSLVLRQMHKEAMGEDVRLDIALPAAVGQDDDPPSALVTLTGRDAALLARRWTGTVQWVCPSPFRPHHKRRNWFVGVYGADAQDYPVIDLEPPNLKIETFRSGGPGGQHQNTTDSGVRITHLSTGISALSTDERSQHRNKLAALERLAAKLILERQEIQARDRSARNQLHKQLERGNPVRIFKGESFIEAT